MVCLTVTHDKEDDGVMAQPEGNIQTRDGNILDDDAEAVVCTVNLQGTMGKGLALDCAKRWHGLERAYATACEDGSLSIGTVFAWQTGELLGPSWVVCVPTKRHWRQPSRLSDVCAGCEALARWISLEAPASIAVPPLGCGLGGLEWAEVRPMIVEHLAFLSVDVHLFEPPGD